MKYYSRLIALLLAVMMLMTNVVMASGINMNDLTLAELESMYAQLADQEVIYEDVDVLGWEREIEAFTAVIDKTGCEFVWYDEFSTEPIGYGTKLVIYYELDERTYTCKLVKDGSVVATQAITIMAAQTTELAAYITTVYTDYDNTCIQDGRPVSEYFPMAYDWMQRWNATLADGSNLAANVLMYWYADEMSYETPFVDPLLCTCYLAEDGLSVTNPAIIKAPHEAHDEDCPWYTEVEVIIPPLRGEQPDPIDPEQFGQYSSNDTYNLDEVGDHAIILPEGGRAVLQSGEAVGYQWQVYDGTQWVNIAGDTGSDIVVTDAKLQSVFALTRIARLRYYDAVNSIVLAETSVTSEKIANGEYVAPAVEVPQTLSLVERDGEETAQTVTISVVLVYSDMLGNVAPTITAVLPLNLEGYTGGTTHVVQLPAVLGYEPTFESDEENPPVLFVDGDRITLTLSAENVDATKTYTVKYAPAAVGFVVEPHLQNLNDDNYTPDGGNTLSIPEGRTNSTVGLYRDQIMGRVGQAYPGFRMLAFETDELIAADGSTKIEVYLDRNYYLMKFDLDDGGYGMEPIYARYGAPVAVNDPTRPGYEFLHWTKVGDTTGAEYSSEELSDTTMPAGNTTYVAVWDEAITNYSVIYWFENADSTNSDDPNNYSVVHVSNISNALTGSTVLSDNMADISSLNSNIISNLVESPAHFTRYTNTGSAMPGSYTVEGDGSTIVNVYYKRNEYTVRFYYARKETNGTRYQISNANNPRRLGNVSWTNGTTSAPAIKEKYHSMLGSMTNGSYTYYYMDLTAKYNANIADKWPDALYDGRYNNYVLGSWFMHENSAFFANMGTQKSYKGQYVRMDDQIITNTATNDPFLPSGISNYCIAFWSTSPSEYTVYIYYDAIEGEPLEGLTTKTYNGQTYILQRSYVTLSNSGMLQPDALIGVDSVGQIGGGGRGDNDYVVEFYYEREKYPLTYMSNGLLDKTVQVPYGAEMSMNGYAEYVPQRIPENMKFAGWYTTEACAPGTEYIFATASMPAHGIILHAKWVPVSRDITFYLDEAALKANNDLSEMTGFETRKVPHGTIYNAGYKADTAAGYTPYTEIPTPKNGSDEFIGWFYRDENGIEKAFDFNTMPVKTDLHVYAKWNTTVMVPVTVNYYLAELKDGKYVAKLLDGKPVKVAESTNTEILNGHLRTFYPKIEGDLYAAYKTGYFPTVPSHSITANKDNAAENTYTFLYYPQTEMPYTVYYVTEVANSVYTGTDKTVMINGTTYYRLLGDKAVPHNTHTVVTEDYEPVPKYLPKNKVYQQVLILSLDPTKNIIVFVYEYNENSTSYTVTHYFEDASANDDVWNGKTYRKGIEDTRPALIGDAVTVVHNTINGYKAVGGEYTYGNLTETWSEAISPTVKIDQTNGELHFNLYYDEITAVFSYIAVGAGGSVQPTSETVKVISGNAAGSTPVVSDGYRFVGWFLDKDCKQPVANEAVIDPNANNKLVPNKNGYYSKYTAGQDVAKQVPGYVSDVFYAKFEEDTVTLNYRIVGPDMKVYAENQDFGTLTDFEESLLAVNGSANGSTATAKNNAYKFVGWYFDVECQNPVPGDWVDVKNKITPSKTDTVWVDDITYYAKFEYNVRDLIVEKTGMHTGESAVVRVVITNDNDVDEYTIVLNADVDHDNDGTPSVIIKDVLIGSTYTVSELDAWTWRYDSNETVTYVATPDSEGNYKIVADVAKNTVIVINSKQTYQWLSDESAVENDLSTGTRNDYNND